jgi:hypothetical protein
MAARLLLLLALAVPMADGFQQVVAARFGFPSWPHALPWAALPLALPNISALAPSFAAGNGSVQVHLALAASQPPALVALTFAPGTAALVASPLHAALPTMGADVQMAAWSPSPSGTVVVLADGSTLVHLMCSIPRLTCTIVSQQSVSFRTLLALSLDVHGTVWFGTALGLFMYSVATPQAPPVADPRIVGPVAALAVSADGRYVAFGNPINTTSADTAAPAARRGSRRAGGALRDGPGPWPASSLYILDQTTMDLQRFWIGGIVDENVTALAFEPATSRLWVGNPSCVHWASPVALGGTTAWRFVRVGGYRENPGSPVGGLPVGNITSIVVTLEGDAWLGSTTGLVLARPTKNGDSQVKFQYFLGARYLADDGSTPCCRDIRFLAAGPTAALAVTCAGISFLSLRSLTLAEKASLYEPLAAPQFRHGIISGLSLAAFGDLPSGEGGCGESDGLWTSLYVAAEAFRFAATGNESARQLAWQAFEGLELLNNVTGIRGLIARSVGLPHEPGCSSWCPPTTINKCFLNSTAMPGWTFMSSLSSDSLTGHLFAYPLMYDLVAQTPSDKARVRALLHNVMSYIVDNE